MPSPTMLVTGGARGIGAGIAIAASAAGYRVAITYEKSRADAEQLVSDGNADVAIQSDAGDPQAVTDTFAAVVDRYGRLDVLVNNAGIGGAYGMSIVPYAPPLPALLTNTSRRP